MEGENTHLSTLLLWLDLIPQSLDVVPNLRRWIDVSLKKAQKEKIRPDSYHTWPGPTMWTTSEYRDLWKLRESPWKQEQVLELTK